MQRLPIAAAPRLTEGQESDGIAVIGEGAVVGGGGRMYSSFKECA